MLRHSTMKLAGAVAIAASLAACGTTDPYGPNNYPVSSINANPSGTAYVAQPTTTYVAPGTTTYVAPGTTTYVAPGTTVVAPAGSTATYIAPGTTVAVPSVEYGRVTNVQLLQPATRASGANAVGGTLIGGVVGGLLGNGIGAGAGRAAATAIGAIIGAGVGQHLATRPYNNYAQAVYRVWVQTDSGVMRTYDVAANSDLRPGDRVRIDNGVIYQG